MGFVSFFIKRHEKRYIEKLTKLCCWCSKSSENKSNEESARSTSNESTEGFIDFVAETALTMIFSSQQCQQKNYTLYEGQIENDENKNQNSFQFWEKLKERKLIKFFIKLENKLIAFLKKICKQEQNFPYVNQF